MINVIKNFLDPDNQYMYSAYSGMVIPCLVGFLGIAKTIIVCIFNTFTRR